MAFSATVELELSAGVWTDVSADVLAPITGLYGIMGNGPNDRVASTGTFRFTLKNWTNSGGVLGYYSPGHVACRGGFDFGIRARIRWSDGASTITRGIGRVVSITPTAGRYLGSTTLVEFVDYMDTAATAVVSGVETQLGQRADELLTTLLAAVTEQPESTDFDAGDSTFAYAFDTTTSTRLLLLPLCAQVVASEGGFLFLTGDGALTFTKRTARAASVAEDADLDDAMHGFAASRQRDAIANKVSCVVHPRLVDAAATTVLYSLGTTPGVAAGQTIRPFGSFVDAANANRRCGGTDMQVPVATTDYVMNAQADGGGADMTADFTVTASFGAAGVSWTITNGHATDTGYLTKLQCRGKGIYDYESIAMEVENAESITAYGERPVTVDMPYEQDLVVGDNYAAYLINLYSAPALQAETVTIKASTSAALLADAMAVDVGSRVVLAETATGVSAACFVQSVGYVIGDGPTLTVTWGLAPASRDSYWLLEEVGYSELDETTRLGFS